MNRSTYHAEQASHYRHLTNLWTSIALACAAISVITYLAVLAATHPLGTPTTPDPETLHPYIEMNLPATDRQLPANGAGLLGDASGLHP